MDLPKHVRVLRASLEPANDSSFRNKAFEQNMFYVWGGKPGFWPSGAFSTANTCVQEFNGFAVHYIEGIRLARNS